MLILMLKRQIYLSGHLEFFVTNRPIINPQIAPSHKTIEVPLSDSFSHL